MNNNFIQKIDPLFIYANLNDTNLTIKDELISWLNYKPIRGDDELLNLLTMELVEDFNYLNEPNEKAQVESTIAKNLVKQPSFTENSTTTTYSVHQQRLQNLSVNSVRSVSSHSTIRSKYSRTNNDTTIASENTKPTLIDTYYDLLKSIHLHITVKPVEICLQKNDLVVVTLPKVDVRSIGTKCDLEEELKGSKLIELPFTNLRACEKTSDKLPWLIDLTGFQV